jgi:hypothetical protein
MAEQKDTTSFFRKVVKFVANPSTDWADLSASTDETRENDFAKSELKAMVERKRRNDFVRKREFDMLRKMRREGLSSEQLAALGGSSKLEDSETRQPEAKGSGGVKAKIDEIEQQMVGDSMGKTQAPRRAPEFYSAATQPAPLAGAATSGTAKSAAAPAPSVDRSAASSRAALLQDSPIIEARPSSPPFVPAAPESAKSNKEASKEVTNYGNRLIDPFTVNVLEVTHDPELDESVIAFANADFEQCEQALLKLTGKNGSRAEHAETWLVLFDLYRAVGQQQKFENLAQDYAQQFGFSAPQWFSMPRLVAQAASDEQQQRPKTSTESRVGGGGSAEGGQVGWACPDRLTTEGVAKLASQCLQMPMPWVFDWAALKALDAEVCARLSELFRAWMPQRLDMRWLAGERLFATLQEMAPTGARDADPAFWVLKLDALRLVNRPDRFDEAAIDYCVTYEVSPPSWEKPVCEVHISGSGASTTAPPLSMVSEVLTSFMESQSPDEIHGPEVASVELSGQLVGDIGPTLKRLEGELNTATIISVSCTKLIRVDFIAAGDLLNWVLARRNENREVHFVDAQRLVALFFGAMGINEHAKVKVRMV